MAYVQTLALYKETEIPLNPTPWATLLRLIASEAIALPVT
jgi:hypothetical protein